MASRIQASGELSVAVPLAVAVGLFTPEGDRAWVPGWDPVYPAGESSEEAGTVFLSYVGGVETIWVVLGIDRDGGETAYARVTPGQHAGTVRVRCRANRDSATHATVTYDMSVLPGARGDATGAYASQRFGEMLDEWRALIELHVERIRQ
jgi:hypothetical protein